MRKPLAALLALTISFILAGCSGEPAETQDPGSDLLNSEPPASEQLPSKTPESPEISESPDPSPAPSDGDAETAALFRDFVYNNYDKLAELTGNSISGIGFIDLDLDGDREMLLFDDGASASMGVNIFDVTDDGIRCISANMEALATEFGNGETSAITINANLMEDFRLLENTETGERFFVVESYNGNIESSFSELIRFDRTDSGLDLCSVYYKYEEYDTDTGEVINQSFRVGSTDAMISGYNTFVANFNSDNADLGLECVGVFIWEAPEYTKSRDQFMSLLDQALTLSLENFFSEPVAPKA